MFLPRKTWTHYAIVASGAWLILASFLLQVQPRALFISDHAAGGALLLFGIMAFSVPRMWVLWAQAAVGAWLLMAPLIFWAKTPAAFINDTVIGTAVLVFSLIIPYGQETGGEATPPGWTYNPSAWHQRLPIIGVGFVAFFIAAYMASFQLGHMDSVWDPIFGEGTRLVLTSEVSKMFPVSDAGLGAVTYLIEALSGLMGDRRRWRTMPWAVLLFGFLVIPAGVVSIVLVILQPWSVGAWCALCLLSAILCVLTIPPAIDEVVASVEFLAQSRKRGKSLLRTFFLGEVEPRSVQIPKRASGKAEPWEWQIVPWNLVLGAILGFWILYSPEALNISGTLAHHHYVMGALILTFAIMAMSEAGRTSRLLNILWGLWLILMPWVLSGSDATVRWNSAAVGLAVIALSVPKGKIKERYGTWTRYIV